MDYHAFNQVLTSIRAVAPGVVPFTETNQHWYAAIGLENAFSFHIKLQEPHKKQFASEWQDQQYTFLPQGSVNFLAFYSSIFHSDCLDISNNLTFLHDIG